MVIYNVFVTFLVVLQDYVNKFKYYKYISLCNFFYLLLSFIYRYILLYLLIVTFRSKVLTTYQVESKSKLFKTTKKIWLKNIKIEKIILEIFN